MKSFHILIFNALSKSSSNCGSPNFPLIHPAGLCGTYDGNIRNDLTLPDGTVYTGRGSAKKGQPKEFNKAWRLVPCPLSQAANQCTIFCVLAIQLSLPAMASVYNEHKRLVHCQLRLFHQMTKLKINCVHHQGCSR